MNDNDMSNIMKQLNNMLQSNEFPDNIKEAINGFKNSSSNNKNNNNSPKDDNLDCNTSSEIDINTILKMKQIIDSMNTNKNDPRSNLLMSLKPYLKESRQKKVDQYIQLFGLSKAFEMFNFLGGENNNGI